VSGAHEHGSLCATSRRRSAVPPSAVSSLPSRPRCLAPSRSLPSRLCCLAPLFRFLVFRLLASRFLPSLSPDVYALVSLACCLVLGCLGAGSPGAGAPGPSFFRADCVIPSPLGSRPSASICLRALPPGSRPCLYGASARPRRGSSGGLALPNSFPPGPSPVSPAVRRGACLPFRRSVESSSSPPRFGRPTASRSADLRIRVGAGVDLEAGIRPGNVLSRQGNGRASG